MNSVEKVARTVEEALELALIQLDTTEENVEVEVLEESTKGFFGLFGNKEVKIKVTLKETSDLVAKKFIEDILGKMGIPAEIQIKMQKDSLYINIVGNDMAILIGRRGQTLDSLQYLVSLVVNKKREEYLRVVLDTEDYRRKRIISTIKLE